MQIVERIKNKCAEKGTTMGTLEKELGFANGTIRRWDEKKPSLDRAYKLANRLDITLEWLITGKEAPDLTPEEQKLVEYYRSMDDTGKRILMNDAAGIANSNPAGVSASKIG